MSNFVYFFQQCPVKIWGLTSADRVARVLQKSGVQRLDLPIDSLEANDSVLIVRSDYLFDDRLIQYLAKTPKIILHSGDQRNDIVAIHAAADSAIQALTVIEGKAGIDSLPGFLSQTPTTTSVAYQEQLRKSEPPFLLPITTENKEELEKRLFDWSYKGITDLVTKWVWPRPARWAVGLCVRWNIRPNHVTLLSLALVIFSGLCFLQGQYGWGLLAGWLMTYLDTVDGKLARVTVQSSRFGHYFDHIIDLVHPPLWYILWGMGLTTAQLSGLAFPLATLLYAIFIGYIAGRLVEGMFHWVLGCSFGIFSWQPIDAYFRLITARRNPNLILLTLSILVGRPELGLLAVTFWTVTTSLFLLGRLLMAGWSRSHTGMLRSWLADVDSPLYNRSRAVRLFTQHARK